MIAKQFTVLSFENSPRGALCVGSQKKNIRQLKRETSLVVDLFLCLNLGPSQGSFGVVGRAGGDSSVLAGTSRSNVIRRGCYPQGGCQCRAWKFVAASVEVPTCRTAHNTTVTISTKFVGYRLCVFHVNESID